MEHPVIYMQVKGVKAKTLAANLRKYSRPGAMKSGHIDKKEICTWNDKMTGMTGMTIGRLGCISDGWYDWYD